MPSEYLAPRDVPERISFPVEEERVQAYWKEIDAFHTANKLSEGKPVYSFYDGPPFATGLPHYGHILAGTIKDTVTRYAYQTGHHVPRRFGWDCHGLPIEFEIEKKLNIKTKEDVLALGIPKYNKECRAIVMRYSKEWESIVSRMGRWIDFENDYKTLDITFMESVWWVFKELHKKGLVYRGLKVMPYSTGCTTPLSNFEANLNYKDVNDPSIIVSFPLVEDPSTSFIAWTTTPWTLPSNLGLCVNPTFTYVTIVDEKTGKTYILAEARLKQLYKNPQKKKGFLVKKKTVGSELVGKRYVPLFDYFKKQYSSRAFKVVADSYVTDTDGTGVVHQAPAFGEDDYRICCDNGIIDKGESLPCPIDANGRFVEPVSDFAGLYVKDADKKIISTLKDGGRLVKLDSVSHSYPFCWRSETPLIYKAVPSWFVSVESFREKLVANNKTARWVPDSVGENRFGSWLESARDWNVSRNRYWGTPMPIWRNEETGEGLIIGSVAELEKLSGISNITDLHRDSIDHIKIISPKTGDTLTRIEEVFDCWFESGSMPYAAKHYPYGTASQIDFESSYPADFIAEGLDQTRGWFYTLLVLSTALFDRSPFRNVVVNGLVLAEDGKKMSKSLKNYPSPSKVINEYGADALRLYLVNSPVVRAEPLRFREAGVRDTLKEVMLPWFNVYRFFVQSTKSLYERTREPLLLAGSSSFSHAKNSMDKWIESALNSLIAFVRAEMAAYRLYTVVPRLLSFIDSLTNWYVRLNRGRLKGSVGSEEENRAALITLGGVLLSLCRLMAPFAPFFSEHMYMNLKCIACEEDKAASVHFLMMPEVNESLVDISGELAVKYMQEVVILGRKARDRKEVSLKQPLRLLDVVHRDEKVLNLVRTLERYVKSELNVREIRYSSEEEAYVSLVADADGRVLGKKLGKDFKQVRLGIQNLTSEQVRDLEREGQLSIGSFVVNKAEIKIRRELKASAVQEGFQAEASASGSGLLIILDTSQDDALVREGTVREIINRIQKLRKASHLETADRVEIFVSTTDERLRAVITEMQEPFRRALNAPVNVANYLPDQNLVVLASCDVEPVNGASLKVTLVRASLSPSFNRILDLVAGNEEAAKAIAATVRCRSRTALGISSGESGAEFCVPVVVDGKSFTAKLKMGEHVFESTWDMLSSNVLQ